MQILYRVAAASLLVVAYAAPSIAKDRTHISELKTIVIAPQSNPAARQDTAKAISLVQQFISGNSYGGSVSNPSCGSNRIEMDVERPASKPIVEKSIAKKAGAEKFHWAIERDLNKETPTDPDAFITIAGLKDGKKFRFIIGKHGSDWKPSENYSQVIAAAENVMHELGLNFPQKIDFSSTMECHTAEYKIKEHKLIEPDLSSENNAPAPPVGPRGPVTKISAAP